MFHRILKAYDKQIFHRLFQKCIKTNLSSNF
jgi:hypothetical protein